MKKWLANIVTRLLLNADRNLKSALYQSLQNNHVAIKYENYRKQYSIAPSFRFNGLNIQLYGEGEILCGENSYIGDLSTIQAAKGFSVTIGNNCSISHNVRVYTSSNFSDQDLNHSENKRKTTGNVVIGNGVWIGANVFIKEGITIGDNAIVGANSVVVKNIEPNSIYGGVPAKLIRMKKHE